MSSNTENLVFRPCLSSPAEDGGHVQGGREGEPGEGRRVPQASGIDDEVAQTSFRSQGKRVLDQSVEGLDLSDKGEMHGLPSMALATNHILTKTEPEDDSAAHETWMMAGETFVKRIIKKEEDFDSCMWPRDSPGETADFSTNEGSRAEEATTSVHRQYHLGHQERPQSYRSLTPSGRNLSSPLLNGSPLMPPQDMGQPSAGPPGQELWACPLCHQRFRLHVQLLVHQNSHREAPSDPLNPKDSLGCPYCPRRFGRSDHLLRHQMSHTGARPHQCPACEKSFTDKSKLTNHFRTHTGERPFHCADCGKHFVRRHHLAKHQRTHTRERPHQCPLCPKSFMQKHHLQKHLRTHTGEKPYKCSLCPKAFACKQRLLQHSCALPPAPASEPAGRPLALLKGTPAS